MHPREVLYKSLLKDLDGIYVEVGTCFGGFSEFLLKNTPARKLFCIDPYRKFSDTEYKDTLNSYTSEENEKKYLMTWVRLKSQFGNRVDMIRSTSVKAAQVFNPETLSVCYIDGNHDYEYVRKDILAWLPKVKKGGILCGDDVEPNPVKNGSVRIDHPGGAFNYCGVHSALISLKEEFPWFDYTIQDGQWYYFVK